MTTTTRWPLKQALNPRRSRQSPVVQLRAGRRARERAGGTASMILQALLVSKDDQAAETLTQVLADFGVAVNRFSAADVAVAHMEEQRFDQIVVDFDDPESASRVLEANRQAGAKQGKPAVTLALLQDSSQVRRILG